MPIEINGSSTPHTKQTGEGGPLRVVRDDSVSRQQDSGNTAQNDSVNLTATAELLQRLDNRISELPVVDNVRVNALRQSIAEGSFRPDPLQVAEKLIDQEIALQSRNRG